MVRALVALLATAVVFSMCQDGRTTDGRQRSSTNARAFRFAVVDPTGDPAIWEPCTGVRLVINPSGAPAGVHRQLTRAAAVVRRVSGLPIRVVATTRVRPAVGYGSTSVRGSWPPVLVGFVRPEDGLLADASSWAETTSVSVEVGQQLRYVSGMILVNVGHDRYGVGSGGRTPWVRLFEHELAHLVGLGHVNDPRSLLYPTILDRSGLTPGDRIGLRLLGGSPRSAPCPDRGWRSGELPSVADKVADLTFNG